MCKAIEEMLSEAAKKAKITTKKKLIENLLSLSALSIEDIAKVSELSIEEVHAIASSMKNRSALKNSNTKI